VVELGYGIGAETRLAHELEDLDRRLRIEVEWLKSPARIERIARERLRMAPPAPSAIQVIRDPAGRT
jgi:cell division protein FtsL